MSARWSNRPLQPCGCGCGGMTRGKWLKGHMPRTDESIQKQRQTRARMRAEREMSWKWIHRDRLARYNERQLAPGKCGPCRNFDHGQCSGKRMVATETGPVVALCSCHGADYLGVPRLITGAWCLVRAKRTERLALTRERQALAREVRRWNQARLTEGRVLAREIRSMALASRAWNRARQGSMGRLQLTEAIASQTKDARSTKVFSLSLDSPPRGMETAVDYGAIPAPSGDADEALAQIVAEKLKALPRKHPAHAIAETVMAGGRISATDQALLRDAYVEAQQQVLAPRKRVALAPVADGGQGLAAGHARSGKHGHGNKHTAKGVRRKAAGTRAPAGGIKRVGFQREKERREAAQLKREMSGVA